MHLDFVDLATQFVAFAAREHALLVIVSIVFLVLAHEETFVEHYVSLDPRKNYCHLSNYHLQYFSYNRQFTIKVLHIYI